MIERFKEYNTKEAQRFTEEKKIPVVDTLQNLSTSLKQLFPEKYDSELTDFSIKVAVPASPYKGAFTLSFFDTICEKIVIENQELKEHLKKYTAPKRSKSYYENNKDEINEKNKEYHKKISSEKIK